MSNHRQSTEGNHFVSSPGDPVGNGETTMSNSFVGKEKLLEDFHRQLELFKEWHGKRDWPAFHHHHYDWWMFPSELRIIV
jgi:hypothetical protein